MTGLETVPEDERPPANTMLHWAFDTMVGIGTGMIVLGLWLAFSWWRRRDFPQTPWFLRVIAISGVAAIVAMECGWIVTEVGRQPWIVYGHMRTEDADMEASGALGEPGERVVVLYTALGVATVLVLRTMARRWRTAAVDEPTCRTGRARRSPHGSADAVAATLWVGVTLYAGLRRRRLRAGLWALLAGAARAASGPASWSAGPSFPSGRPTTSG